MDKIQTVFTRPQSISAGAKANGVSPKQAQTHLKKGDVVVIETSKCLLNGKIVRKVEVKKGLCATAILARVQANDYNHTLHWPELNQYGDIVVRKNGHDPNCIAVISDDKGTLHIKKGEAAEKIFAEFLDENLAKNYQVEFIPPSKLRELKKKTQKLV